MKKSEIKVSLMASASIIALGLAAPALAQGTSSGASSEQPAAQSQGQTAGPRSASKQGSAQHQPSLTEALSTLEQARQSIESANSDGMRRAQQQAGQALQDVETHVQSMQGDQADAALKNISAAQQALENQSNKERIVLSLDVVTRDVRLLQQSTAQTGGGSGQDPSSRATKQKSDQQSAQIQVQQKAPDISVTQPAPDVIVQQPAPQVSIQQPRPEVTIEQPRPDVTVTQAEPNVTVQKQGEPQVTIRRQGEPEVNVESGQKSTQQGIAQSGSSSTATDQSPGQQTATLDRQQVVGKNVWGANNDNLGEVEDVVMSPGGQVESVLVDVGGFLGIGSRRVAIPIDRVQLQGDRLMTTLTQQQAEQLPEYNAAQ